MTQEKERILSQCDSWLARTNLKSKVVTNPRVFSDIQITFLSGISVHIVQNDDKTDEILIHSKLDFDSNLQAITASDSDKKLEFLKSVNSILLKKGVQFGIEYASTAIKSITLERILYGEGLKKQELLDSALAVHEANLLTRLELTILIGSAQSISTSGQTSTFVHYG